MATEKIDKVLYGGGVTIVYYPNSHQYKLDGKNLLSVTGILGVINKPMLIPWAVNQAVSFLQGHLGEPITDELLAEAKSQHEKVRDEAASLGHQVHEWCNGYLMGKEPPLPEDIRVMNGVLAFLKWVEEHDVKFTESEKLVYSKQCGYVGTMDAVAIIDGKKCVLDFKTGKGVYPEHHMQVAAYRHAAEEEGMEFDGDSVIVQFGKEDGEFKVYPCPNHVDDLNAFLSALEIKKWQKKYGK